MGILPLFLVCAILSIPMGVQADAPPPPELPAVPVLIGAPKNPLDLQPLCCWVEPESPAPPPGPGDPPLPEPPAVPVPLGPVDPYPLEPLDP